MKNPKITLQDVAKRAGMSAATASRALRGLSVHKKHQGKAQAAALELGYVVNEAARSLRSVRTMTVGMVYHDLTSLLGMELLRAMAAGLEEVGYSLFVSTAQGRNDLYDTLVHRFLQRRVDALVCVHSNGEGQALQGFIAADIPVMALITKAGGYSDLPMVRPSIDQAATQCVARLRELGHRTVSVIAPDRPVQPIDTFIAVARAGRMKITREEISEAAPVTAESLRALMARDRPPTAIVALQQDAVKIVETARRLKLKIPADISLVSIRDRSQPPPTLQLALSTIHLNPQPMGAAAAAALKAWLVDGVALTEDLSVSIGEWIERDTTGPVPG